MTLGKAAIAKVRLIVWCKAGGHQVEPGPAELARTYGPDVAVPDWRARLMCSRCGSRNIRPQGMAKQDKSASLSRTTPAVETNHPPGVDTASARRRAGRHPAAVTNPLRSPHGARNGSGVVRDDYRAAAPAPRWRRNRLRHGVAATCRRSSLALMPKRPAAVQVSRAALMAVW
jgi:hypothetical protein